MIIRQNSCFEIQNRLTYMLLTYFAAIDDKQLNLDLYKSLFSEMGTLIRPNGPVKGPLAIFESQNESFKRFRATQHVVTNMLFTETDKGWKLILPINLALAIYIYMKLPNIALKLSSILSTTVLG